MGHRVVTWAILIWTAFMALGMFAAFLGIGDDCAGMTGSALSACQGSAWTRGAIGLGLLLFLWFVIVSPMVIVWLISRPKENVAVFGPAGQQVMLSEHEARKRVEQPGWAYQRHEPGGAGS